MRLAGYYRGKAEQCERLALGVSDERTRAALDSLHREYVEKATAVDRPPGAGPGAGEIAEAGPR
jgi:hypothetical protein